eukprot:CAMPEP_0118954056 /NCGR_PEP_ID=MMETSP1169-20130426/57623_1 /TAXON_ID=36882 /ORGANISM="Pyramimonas obovata, Strain CCMP722" /LENGTH=304 /DNA_ID=CAMNT_0006901627 /DNA_START=186 /DNA_END=1097 /DNA_ORIENTATION=+
MKTRMVTILLVGLFGYVHGAQTGPQTSLPSESVEACSPLMKNRGNPPEGAVEACCTQIQAQINISDGICHYSVDDQFTIQTLRPLCETGGSPLADAPNSKCVCETGRLGQDCETPITWEPGIFASSRVYFINPQGERPFDVKHNNTLANPFSNLRSALDYVNSGDKDEPCTFALLPGGYEGADNMLGVDTDMVLEYDVMLVAYNRSEGETVMQCGPGGVPNRGFMSLKDSHNALLRIEGLTIRNCNLQSTSQNQYYALLHKEPPSSPFQIINSRLMLTDVTIEDCEGTNMGAVGAFGSTLALQG